MLWGGRNTANKYHWRVWGVLAVYGPHWVAPAHGACAFPVYTAQAPGCSAGELSKVGPGLCALPRSKLLRFRFSGTPQRYKLGWACVLCPSPGLRNSGNRCLVSTLSQVYNVSYHLTGPSCSISWVRCKSAVSGVPCVFSGGADLRLRPSLQMSTV